MEGLPCLMQGNVAPMLCCGTANSVAISQFEVAWVCILHWWHARGFRASVLHVVLDCVVAIGCIARGTAVATEAQHDHFDQVQLTCVARTN